MDNAQKLTLRTHIQANQTQLAFNAGTMTIAAAFAADGLTANGDSSIIAQWYNQPTSPAVNIYRNAVPMSEIMLNGFDWSRVDNLSAGKARVWEWMRDAGPLDPSKPNIRAGINAVWVGTAADLAVRAAVYLHCHRVATRFEAVFSTGVGTVPAADGSGPAVASLTGEVTADEIADIKGLPA